MIVHLFSPSLAQEVPCTYTASDNSYYDLSPLALPQGAPDYYYVEEEGLVFGVNICAPASNFSCKTNTTVCQKNGANSVVSCGVLHNQTFADHPEGADKGVTIYYGTGRVCNLGIERWTTIVINCEPTATTLQFYYESNMNCEYNLFMNSSYACPIASTTTDVFATTTTTTTTTTSSDTIDSGTVSTSSITTSNDDGDITITTTTATSITTGQRATTTSQKVTTTQSGEESSGENDELQLKNEKIHKLSIAVGVLSTVVAAILAFSIFMSIRYLRTYRDRDMGRVRLTGSTFIEFNKKD